MPASSCQLGLCLFLFSCLLTDLQVNSAKRRALLFLFPS
ncbi:Uncharacterized protein APZ42_006951 [Daphnia magna]|uniref:Uncharacterized protein n=1 Tax=Daphnia magna TaxID=35525 RepID=A0A164FLQ4_9CRUS|nr:Uncharacterized protein APZ42_006951 [Daphnia magna]